MGIIKRDQPNDVLFLQPVRFADEKIPRGKVRMLYCDISGKVYSSFVNRTLYERARASATGMARRRRYFATVGLETAPGQFVPATVEIGQKDVWALEHILEHALKNGKLPDILKKYLKPIIKLNESERETAIADYRKRRRQVQPETTPKVLERLPYYPEEEMEVSMPIYKAEYTYPLVVLKMLPPDVNTPRDTSKMLVLDSDGDMAVMEMPTRVIRKMEIEFTGYSKKKRDSTCVLISKNKDGYTLGYMTVSRQQKKSLDVLTRYFEETGSSKQRVSLAVQTVITRAKDSVSSQAS
ncbi:MAG: hypothetical protein JXA51_03270 [Dehalococcoidales bacterium]|nr:hypothetical protein [Dehalococcoidales bacterium]